MRVQYLAKLYLEQLASTDPYRKLTSDRRVHEFELTKGALTKQILNAVGIDKKKEPEASKRVVGISNKFFVDIKNALKPRSRKNGYTVTAMKNNTSSRVAVRVEGPRPNSDVYGWIFEKLATPKATAYDALKTLTEVREKGTLGEKKDFLDISHEQGTQIGANAFNQVIQEIEGDFLARPGISYDQMREFEMALATNLKKVNKTLGGAPIAKITYKSSSVNREEAKEDKRLHRELMNIVENTANQFLEEPVYRKIERDLLTSITEELRTDPNIHLKGFKIYDTKDAKAVLKKSIIEKVSKQELNKAKNQLRYGTQANKIGVAALLGYINKGLPGQIASNMGSPALNYRTGRFAQSAYATSARQTESKGRPISISYTYKKDPYSLFEYPGGSPRLATPERDPRNIIDKSIRELASDIIKVNFYSKRVWNE